METKRILELADVIEKQPHVAPAARKGFNMWGYNHPCGTPSCIAGWAIYTFRRVRSYGDSPHDHGARILGISHDDACDLFDPEHFVAGVNDQRDITPAHAAAVLRNLASTGKVDWSAAKAHGATVGA